MKYTEVYYTFGSDPAFPFGRGEYVNIIGQDIRDCNAAFRKHFPPRDSSNVLNCSDYYTRERWEQICREHGYGDPVKTFVSDSLYGTRKEGFDNLWIYVPKKQSLVFIQEGSGDNLDHDDAAEGYVDYIDYTSYDIGFATGDLNDSDGGMEMFRQPVQERYGCLTDAVPDILFALYGDSGMEVMIMKDKEDIQ